MTHIHVTKQEVYSFLLRYNLAVFGTTSPDHSPHLTSMFYVVDPDLNFYFITKSETEKVKNIALNPHVSVVVSDRESYKTVEASGVVVALSGIERIKTVIQMFAQVYRNEGVLEASKLFGWPPPIEKIEDGEIVVYELQPSQLIYSDYSEASPLDGDYIQEIISS